MNKLGAAAVVAAALALKGCPAITGIAAGISAAGTVYSFAGQVENGAVGGATIACKLFYDKAIGKDPNDKVAIYGISYCKNPPTGSDPITDAVWLGGLIEMMKKEP